ncbi:conserved hypothetical protein [Ixodes scapularis]|uniref:Reelin domain-containing protein n=1 Tax=Ixodes scapularis TaxID=6945 RepID=B7P325_IXOSC|nr:conserved hypothetical protein [Ixodes scapularis]|eukprot:XP_002403505.1 conserved hypothetical protein [Ixodes scapularis]
MASSSWGPCLGLLCLAMGCDAYHNGAPLRQCAQMTPFHRPLGAPQADAAYPPQTVPSPYTVTADKQTDQVINVKLNGTRTFKGFFVQARETADLDKLVPGTFAFTDSETKTVDCSDIPNVSWHAETKK